MARHAQAIERQERLAPGDEAHALGDNRERIERRDRQPNARRLRPTTARSRPHGAQVDVLAAQDVALADRAARERREWPAATSSTCTRLSPVSTNAGMRPLAASTMMRPVGVGLTSRGPIESRD